MAMAGHAAHENELDGRCALQRFDPTAQARRRSRDTRAPVCPVPPTRRTVCCFGIPTSPSTAAGTQAPNPCQAPNSTTMPRAAASIGTLWGRAQGRSHLQLNSPKTRPFTSFAPWLCLHRLDGTAGVPFPERRRSRHHNTVEVLHETALPCLVTPRRSLRKQ